MPSARAILDTLSRDRLIELADANGLRVIDRRVRAQLLDALTAGPCTPGDLLGELSRDELKSACRALGLDDSGREKSLLVARLLAGDAPQAPQPPLPFAAPTAPTPSAPPAPSAPPTPSGARRFQSFAELSAFLFGIADILRGAYKPAEYGKVFLPMTLLRRFDCVAAPHRADALRVARDERARGRASKVVEREVLDAMAGRGLHFMNLGEHDMQGTLGPGIADSFNGYVNGWTANVVALLDHFGFKKEIDRLHKADRLYQVVSEFCSIDLSPAALDNHAMGMAFEDLIRRFAETSNETAGEHYTPRDVIELMVDLTFASDGAKLSAGSIRPQVYDPACGTGGMLSVAAERIVARNPAAHPLLFGQEINGESYALCQGDMLIRGAEPDDIAHGNTLTEDRHRGKVFDYQFSNPPFGVDWKADEKAIRKEHEESREGRFGPGLPRVSDGSLLFLLHMAAKMRRPEQGGGRIAIVLNGSPLFTGDAGSGESEIRRWLFEGDLVEAIVALPDQLFFNTGIATYVWMVTNRKPPERRGRVLLIDASERGQKMRRSQGNKRNELPAAQRDEVVAEYEAFADGPRAKVFRNDDFGYRKVTVERPLRMRFQATPEAVGAIGEQPAFRNLTDKRGLTAEKVREGRGVQAALRAAVGELDPEAVYTSWAKLEAALEPALRKHGARWNDALRTAVRDALGERDPEAEPVRDSDGALVPDPELRDTENVPLTETVEAYVAREVLPHAPDAWVDGAKEKVGYEVAFTRYFYTYTPPRPPAEIAGEVLALEKEIQALLAEVDDRPSSAVIAATLQETRAVVPRKDSGVPWIGEVPAGWDVTRVRDVVSRIQIGPFGSQLHAGDYVFGGTPIINPSHIIEDAIVPDEDCCVDEPTRRRLSLVAVSAGDVILARRGELGRCSIIGERESGWLCGTGSMFLTPNTNKLDARFLVHVARSPASIAYLNASSVGSTMSNLNRSIIGRLALPLPALPEQRAIAAHLDAQCERLDALGQKLRRQLALLREYRQSLVTACVTGRHPVPTVEVPA